MQGRELRELRRNLGDMDALTFARAIGYTGTDRNDTMRIRSYERGTKQIPLYIARSAWMLKMWWLTHQYTLPKFPEWTGYDYTHEPDQRRDI